VVDDKGIPLTGHLKVGEQFIELFHIQGGPEHTIVPAFRGVFYGDNKVGDMAEAQEYIADVLAAFDHLFIPLLITVILALETIRAHIGPLNAERINQPKILKPAEAVLEIPEYSAQPTGFCALLKAVVMNNKVQRGFAFLQKVEDGPVGIGYQPGGAEKDLGFEVMLRGPVIDHGHEDQGRNGNHGREDNRSIPEAAKLAFGPIRGSRYVLIIPEFRLEFLQ